MNPIKIVVGSILLGLVIFFSIGVRRTGDHKDNFEDRVLSRSDEKFIVLKVLDGDTIKLANGMTVRYIGIDSPENSNNGSMECYAAEAYLVNRQLVEGKAVTLEKDVSDKDKYGRLLRYVYVKLDSGFETMVNQYMIREGFARAATYPPDVKYSDLFIELQREAVVLDKGLWSNCLTDDNTNSSNPKQPKIINSDTTTYDCTTNIYDCSDFDNQVEAQNVLEFCGLESDVHNLDSDRDGLACEPVN